MSDITCDKVIPTQGKANNAKAAWFISGLMQLAPVKINAAVAIPLRYCDLLTQ